MTKKMTLEEKIAMLNLEKQMCGQLVNGMRELIEKYTGKVASDTSLVQDISLLQAVTSMCERHLSLIDALTQFEGKRSQVKDNGGIAGFMA